MTTEQLLKSYREKGQLIENMIPTEALSLKVSRVNQVKTSLMLLLHWT